MWIVKAEHVGTPNVVLAATDFSDVSFKAVKQRLWVTERANAEFHLLHVIESMDVPEDVISKIPNGSSLRQEINEESQKRLDAFLESLQVDRTDLADLLDSAARRGALVCQWPGHLAGYRLEACSIDPFIHQELTEVMYHTLWETVHVFFEQEKTRHDAGASAFLYPFLDQREAAPANILDDVAASICTKAAEDERLRSEVAASQSEVIAAAAEAIAERVLAGGAIVTFGNGGSATDANDLAIDCVAPPAGMRPIPAISLSMEPATISAIANDVGVELVFLRQLIANGRAGDVAVAISTSGKSKNICAALQEARKRGMLTVALLGYDGGDIVHEHLADFSLVVHWDYIPRIQEVQASIYHVLRRALAELVHP